MNYTYTKQRKIFQDEVNISTDNWPEKVVISNTDKIKYQ